MRRSDPLLMLTNGDRLGRLEEPARTVGELFKVHLVLPLFALLSIWCCTTATQAFDGKACPRTNEEDSGSLVGLSCGVSLHWRQRGGGSGRAGGGDRSGLRRKRLADARDILWVDDRRTILRDRRIHVPAPELGAVDMEPEVGI